MSIKKKTGKISFKFFFGLEKRHLNKKFNKWRLELLQKGIQSDKKIEHLVNKIPDKFIENHWVKDKMDSEYKKLVTKFRAAMTIEFIQTHIKNYSYQRIADIGASDGLFLYPFKGELVGLNIEQICVDQINSHGFKGVAGDIHKLPFDDNYFDIVFCFEVLEHLESPLIAFKELSRISNRYIFYSVPFVKNTVLKRYNTEPQKASTNQHVFMLNSEDLKNLASYTNMKITDCLIIDPVSICKLDIFKKIKMFLINYRLPRWIILIAESKN
jgi:SAM-dependent methyltransferase